MQLQKIRWSKVYESSEEELTDLLVSKNIMSGERVELEAGEAVELQQHTELSRIWCAEGAMTLTSEAKTYSVQVGDCFPIPAQQAYELQAGLAGCAYYQTI